MMKIILDVQKMKAVGGYNRGIKIKFKIGETLIVCTEIVYLKNQWYAFLEKHTLYVSNNDALYLEVTVLSETNQSLAQITVFFCNFKNQHHLVLGDQDENQFTLFYQVREIQAFQYRQKAKSNKSKSQIKQDSTIIEEELGKLQMLKMGLLVYNFLSKLDPLVFICTKIKHIIYWKDPFTTILVGIILTLVVIYPKMSLFFGGLSLYSCRNFIIKKLQKIHKYDRGVRKSILPDENIFFLRNILQLYCDIYQTFAQYIFKHDKTLLLYIINILCKTGGLVILLLFMIRVSHLVLVVIWIGLLLTSPLKEGIKGYGKPICLKFVSEFAKIMDSITARLKNILVSQKKVTLAQNSRQFYFYHYERWSLGEGWHDQDIKYSDKDYQCIAMMKKNPPLGWQWVQSWQVDYEQKDDEEGYQFSNDLMNSYSSFMLIANRRRRKWKRCCVKAKSL